MERVFEDEQIKNAIMECGSDKASGPDGFNFCFIKACWDFLKRDFIDMLKEFLQRDRLNKAMNTTFLTLISKVPNPMDLQDYRPITMVGCVYIKYYWRC